MNKTKWIALVAAALVFGLVAGNIVSAGAVAAPSTSASASAGATRGAGLGLKLGAAMRDAGGRLVDQVAKLTGQTVEEVAADRAAGTSFADIASAGGSSADEVVAQTLAVREKLLAEQVAAGRITQAQADQALARMKTRLTERVSSTAAGCDGMGGGRGGGRGAGMRGGCGGSGAGGGACGAGAGGCSVAAPATTAVQ